MRFIRIHSLILLTLFPCVSAHARVETVRFQSKLVNTALPYNVILPPDFYFDFGTEDVPLVFNFNRELSSLMLEKKIPHEYRQMPGDHTWAYWDRQVQEILKIAAEKMRLPRTMKTTRAARA